MRRPDREQILMETAYLWAKRSTCTRASVGVVIEREGRILVQGYNGAPAGLPHCTHAPDEPKDKGCEISVHAEANAISYAARHGIPLQGATLHSTRAVCWGCAKLVVNAGIYAVRFAEVHRDMEGIKLLQNAHISVVQHDMMVA